jgi:hypothetical protein
VDQTRLLDCARLEEIGQIVRVRLGDRAQERVPRRRVDFEDYLITTSASLGASLVGEVKRVDRPDSHRLLHSRVFGR